MDLKEIQIQHCKSILAAYVQFFNDAIAISPNLQPPEMLIIAWVIHFENKCS